ncbi:MAG: hypothetical protein WA961_14525 [Rhodanobacter sp.]
MSRAEDHPFYAGSHQGHVFHHLCADDRLRAVRDFDAARCHAALRLPNLQKTVRTAIERRLRKLEAAS